MLTPSAVANAKPQASACKLADERGMYLLVQPNGARQPMDLVLRKARAAAASASMPALRIPE